MKLKTNKKYIIRRIFILYIPFTILFFTLILLFDIYFLQNIDTLMM